MAEASDLRDAWKAVSLMRSDVQRLKQDNAALSAQLQMFQQHKFDSEQRVREACQDKVDALTHENEELRRALEQAKQQAAMPERDDGDNQLEEAQEMAVRDRLELLARMAAMQQEHAASMAAVARARKELEEQCEKSNQDALQLNLEVIALREQLGVMTNEKNDLEAKHQEAVKAHRAEGQLLQEQVQRAHALAKNHRDTSEEARAQQQLEMEGIRLELTQASARIKHLATALAQEEQRVIDRDAQIERLQQQQQQTQLAAVRTQDNTKEAKEAEQWRTEHATLQKEVRRLEAETRELKQRLEEVENMEEAAQQSAVIEKEDLLATIHELTKALSTAQVHAEEKQQAMKQRLQDEAEALERTLKALKEAKAESLRLEHRCEEHKRAGETMLEEMESLRIELSTWQAKYDEKEEQFRRLDQVRNCVEVDFQAKQNELQREVASYKHLYEELRQDSDKCVKQLEERLEQTRESWHQEVHALKQQLQQARDEIAELRDESDSSRRQLMENEETLVLSSNALECAAERTRALELSLMAQEDAASCEFDTEYAPYLSAARAPCNNPRGLRVWEFVRSKTKALDEQLLQAQNFVAELAHVVHLCNENADALEEFNKFQNRQLSVEALKCVQLAERVCCQAQADRHVEQVQSFGTHLVSALRQWHEAGIDDEAPPPTFDIASREVDHILQNWTNDRPKRLSTKQWLYTMAHLNEWPKNAKGEPITTRMLELQHMTLEVKQAFIMLVIPILKLNPVIFVRVFSRKMALTTEPAPHEPVAMERSSSALQRQRRSSISFDDDEDRCWEMKIVVQKSKTAPMPDRRHSTIGVRTMPSPPLGPAPDVQRHSSALQLIQERLSLYQQGRSSIVSPEAS